MTAVVKTLTPARPVKSLLSTNIPFLDRNNQDAFSTRFQEDFQPFSFKKAKPFRPPTPAQVLHKDLRFNMKQVTEAMESYHHHSLPKKSHTPRWTMLYTNFKMQTDSREGAFCTTQSQDFCPQPFQRPPTLMRPLQAIKIQRVERLPESTTKATFTPHRGFPVSKSTAKYLEEGLSKIKGDKRYCSFVSQYNDSFQGAWSRAAPPVDKHRSSVVMGDPVKIVDRETNYSTSFSRPVVCRYKPPVVKEHLKLNLGNFPKDSWSSTFKEAFCHHKPVDPVVLAKGNQTSSSLPKWDTESRYNTERMPDSINRISFSDLNDTEPPVHVPGPSLRTKSHVQFSSPVLSGLYYTTTAQEHYNKKDGERARPAIQLPSNILSGSEHGLRLSTTGADFLPLKTCRKTPCLSQRRSNIKFPLAGQHFSTTHGEHYKAKPSVPQHPGFTNFVKN